MAEESAAGATVGKRRPCVAIRERETGEIRRIVELEDPCETYCSEFNRAWEGRELFAEPYPDS